MAVCKVTLVKRGTFRGLPEEFSNTYHLNGNVTAQSDLDVLARAIWDNVERGLHNTGIKLVHTYGYFGANNVADMTHAYENDTDNILTGNAPSTGNPMAGASFVQASGLTVALVARAPAGTTSKGRPRYVYKYWHTNYVSSGDAIPAAQVTALNTWIAKLANGTSLPSAARLCRPDGGVTGLPTVMPYWGFHQLKRRGKRPTTP